MADEEKGVLPLHAAAEKLNTLKVEIGGRLVRKEQGRVFSERSRQLTAGLFPAAHAICRGVRVPQAETAELLRAGRFLSGAELDKKGDRTAGAHRALIRPEPSRENGEKR